MGILRKLPTTKCTTFLLVLAILIGSALGSLGVPMFVGAYTEKSAYVSVSGGDTLRVRSGPGTSYDTLDRLATGTTVTIIEEKNASDGALWYQIRYGDNKEGYVHSQYIVIVETAEPDEEFETAIAAFPESYKKGLRTLHAMYPNWKFIPQETGLDWNYAVEQESVLGRSLIATGSISSWKSTQNGAYNWDTSTWVGLDGAAWVQASREITAYYMDPRTYLDGNLVFVFLDYSYDENLQNLDGLKRIVKGTFLEGTFTENGTTYSYPEVIMDVATKSGMNPYVMAAMINVEIGSKGTSNSISGTLPGYEGLYNYYNIGAYATNGMTAIERGLWYAGGSGSGQTSYDRPWNTRYGALLGGAKFYTKNYVNAGQNTLYLKKFNVMSSNPFTHQYMTNVQGAATEAKVMAKAYDEATREAALVFKIPVYKDMPQNALTKPTGDGSPNNKLAGLAAQGYTLSPAFNTETLEYDIVVENHVTSITLQAEAKDSKATIQGTGTFALKAGVNTFDIVVTAENGQTRTYQVNVAGSGGSVPEEPTTPEETTPEETTPEETTPEETTPEETTPQAPVIPPVTWDTALNVSDSEGTLSGLTSVPMKADALVAALGLQNGSAKVLKADGAEQTGNVGTGNVVQIYNNAGELQKQYTVVVYGDANGDGKMTSVDLLRIQRGILKLVALEGVYQTAADGNRDGKVSSTDLLRIQKALIGQGTVSQ